jgi:low temperature requirement protein LtrA
MSTSSWTLIAGGTAGLALAVFGGLMLLTGRAPDTTQRAFRSTADAGRYHLLFGSGLLLVVLGTVLKGVFAVVTAVLAVILVGIAVVRFRPRGHRNRPASR